MKETALTVLVVDDDDSIRSLLQMELEDRGFGVIQCASQNEAVSVIGTEATIDIILLDLRLGDGTGMEVLKQVHESKRKIPVIMMTGHGNKGVVLEALKHGVFDFLEKPFSVRDDLFPVISRAEALALLSRENNAMLAEMKHNAKLVALGEISAVVMHDIRGPLSSILMCCDDMLEEAEHAGSLSAETVGVRATQIVRSSTRIESLVERLRSFSRQDCNEVETWEDLGEIIDSAVYLASRKIRDLQVGVSKTVSESCRGIKVLCPRNGLEQALMNLFSNACDAMNESVIRKMIVHVENDEQDLLLSVSDTGTGMSPETMEALKQAFFTTKGASEGTGLGVKIVRDVAAAIGGRLSVCSTLGVGSTFVICIPLCRAQGADGSSVGASKLSA
jgi:signal transduction histidine kinase